MAAPAGNIKAVVLDCFGVLYVQADISLVRNEELLALVQGLRPRYKIGLLSNVLPGAMDNYFTQAERHELFDATVLSSDVPYAKPDPEIYKLVCDQLGVQPGQAVFIDDSPLNCEGAVRAGMQAILYSNIAHIKSELLARLG